MERGEEGLGVVSQGELYGVWKNYFPCFVVEGLINVLEKQEICYASFGYESVMVGIFLFYFILFCIFIFVKISFFFHYFHFLFCLVIFWFSSCYPFRKNFEERLIIDIHLLLKSLL